MDQSWTGWSAVYATSIDPLYVSCLFLSLDRESGLTCIWKALIVCLFAECLVFFFLCMYAYRLVSVSLRGMNTCLIDSFYVVFCVMDRWED